MSKSTVVNKDQALSCLHTADIWVGEQLKRLQRYLAGQMDMIMPSHKFILPGFKLCTFVWTTVVQISQQRVTTCRCRGSLDAINSQRCDCSFNKATAKEASGAATASVISELESIFNWFKKILSLFTQLASVWVWLALLVAALSHYWFAIWWKLARDRQMFCPISCKLILKVAALFQTVSSSTFPYVSVEQGIESMHFSGIHHPDLLEYKVLHIIGMSCADKLQINL